MAVSPRPWRESGRESSRLDTSKHSSSSPERCVSPARGWLGGAFITWGGEEGEKATCECRENISIFPFLLS